MTYSNSIQMIRYHEIPNDVNLKIKGEAYYDNKKWFVLDGIRYLPWRERLIKLIWAFAFTFISSGFALVFPFVTNLWEEGVFGRKRIIASVEANSIPQQKLLEFGVDGTITQGRAVLVQTATKRTGIMVEYVKEGQEELTIISPAKPIALPPPAKRETSKKAEDEKKQSMASISSNGSSVEIPVTPKTPKTKVERKQAPEPQTIEQPVEEQPKQDSDSEKETKRIRRRRIQQSITCAEDLFTDAEYAKEKEQAKEIVSQYGMSLLYLTDSRLKDDKDVVLAAVKNDGNALKYASKKMRKEREVVLQAVSNNGLALLHAASPLKKDRGVVTAAVTQNRLALQYAAGDLQTDVELVALSEKPYPPSPTKLAMQAPLDEKVADGVENFTFMPGSPIKVRLPHRKDVKTPS